MKRLLPVAFALAGIVLSFPRLSAQRPVFTTGTTAELAAARSIGLERLSLVASQKAIDGPNDLLVTTTHVDRQSMAHVRVQQRFQGIPVLGGEAIAHLNPDGSPFADTDSLVAGISVSTTPRLTPDAAIDLAVAHYGCRSCLTKAPTADLWIVRDNDGVDHLTYRVQLVRLDGTNETALPVRFVDARDGQVVLAYDNLQTGTGNSLYSGVVNIGTYHNPTFGDYVMENLVLRVGTFDFDNVTRQVGLLVDADDMWDSPTQRAGVDAHYAMERYFGYLSSVHGRNGIDGAGGPFVVLGDDGATTIAASIVHFGNLYNNAFWDPNAMVMAYGDGDGSLFSPLVALDIAGHEMTHGVTQFTAGLLYHAESGALNESWSDVFGAMLERDVRGESANTWLLAEEAYTPSIPGDALRYLDDPHRAVNGGWTADDQPDHYSERCTSTCPDTPQGDNGGVHINSGIANKAFYLVAKGGTHHLGGSMTGIGADKAAQIWFTALTSYMTSSTNFAGARDATTLAASALYGSNSDEQKAVARAWCLVGVGTCVTVDALSVTPNAGAGTAQPFGLYFSDSAGATDLSSARVRFATSAGQGAGTCSISYNAVTAQIKLMDDAGVWGAPVPLGSGTLSNSQCTLNLAFSTATPIGDSLALSLVLTFSGTFTGAKNIYMLATSASAGITTGWVRRGTWTPSGVAVLSVTPNSGAGFTRGFNLQYADSQGPSDLVSARVRFGSSNVGPGTCSARYNATNGAIELLNDAGTVWTAGTMGTGTLANSQCTLNLASSFAIAYGNTLNVFLTITFNPSFAGVKQIYMQATGVSGATTGWQQRGTWTVPPPGPAVISVSPSSGTGASQAFTLEYTDTNGAANLTSARVRFGTSNVGPGTCTARYSATTNVIGLLDDTGTTWSSAPPGVATLSNSQCTINLPGTAAHVSGPNLSLLLPVVFTASFAGSKNVYMLATDAGGANSGWQQRGTWTVPSVVVTADSVTPDTGAGFTRDFTLHYSDSFGAADITSARVRFGASNVGPGTCTASYNAATNAVALLNDAGTASSTGVLGSGTLSNSQCTLNLASSSASSLGTNLTLVLNVTFAPAFVGAKNVYLLAKSSAGPNSGWQQRGTWTVPPASAPTMLFIDSQPNDWVGQGQQYSYTPADATFTAIRNPRNGVRVLVVLGPSQLWLLDFAAAGDVPLQVGSYGNVTRLSFTRFAGMDVSGLLRGCSELTGRFKVLEAIYDGSGNVLRFAVDFEQHCEDADPALFGALRYNSTVSSPSPFDGEYPSYKLHVTAPTFGYVTGDGINCGDGAQACDISRPFPSMITLTATPVSGYLFSGWTGKCHGGLTITLHLTTESECSAVFAPLNSGQPMTVLYWNSQVGDWIGAAGAGGHEVYALGNSVWEPIVTGDPNGGHGASVRVDSIDDKAMSSWTLRFNPPLGQQLTPGTYLNAERFATATAPGLEVTGNSRGCNLISGSFIVHAISMSGNTISSLAVDFEQHCDGMPIPAHPLIGSIRYNSAVPITASLALTFTGHGTVTLSPSGTICTFNCTETAVAGTAYVMNVQPDPGWSFVSWTGDEDCIDGSLTLTAPTACHVTFQQTPAPVSEKEPPIGP